MVGGPNLLRKLGAALPPELDAFAQVAAGRGQAAVFLTEDGRAIAAFAVADAVRPESRSPAFESGGDRIAPPARHTRGGLESPAVRRRIAPGADDRGAHPGRVLLREPGARCVGSPSGRPSRRDG
jgi:hypothetical protein